MAGARVRRTLGPVRLSYDIEDLSPRWRRRWAVIWLWARHVFPPLAIGLLALAGWRSGKAFAVPGWPTVAGVITRTNVSESHSLRRGTRLDFECEYAYEVGGRRYTGDRIHYAGSNGDGEQRRRAEQYVEEASVTVRYDPADPADAVLELGNPWLDLGMAVAFAGLAVAMWWHLGRRMRRILTALEAPSGDADSR